jgi:hypothetical protein
MPALPWTTFSPADPAHDYVAMASRLPLARYWDLPAFLSATLAIRAQLARASGLIGYALDAHLARKTFYTSRLGKARTPWTPLAARTRTAAASAFSGSSGVSMPHGGKQGERSCRSCPSG